jgi:hypothetical protein
VDSNAKEGALSGIAAAALGLLCGGCVGWTFALAVDLARPAIVERAHRPRASTSVPSSVPDPRSVTGY